MACLPPNPKAQSNSINAVLKKQKKEHSKRFKVLLLGTGDSGKSTVFKQMKFLYGTEDSNSVTEGVLKNASNACLGSIILDTQNILKALSTEVGKQKALVPEDFPELSDNAKTASEIITKLKLKKAPDEKVAKSGFTKEEGLQADVAEAIKTIWNDSAVQKLWDTLRSNLEISESYGYFADKLSKNYPEFGGKGWYPNDEDYLLTRSQTTGVHSCKFSIAAIRKGITNEQQRTKKKKKSKNDGSLELIDVGGQVAERRKWIKVFDGVPVVLFVTAISEYDQVLWEDKSKNRFIDSLNVFREVIHHKVFRDTNFIMFLNKADIFKEKLCEKKIPLNISGEFSDAPDTHDFDKGVEWITSKFKDICLEEEEDESQPRTQSVIYHVTTATDTKNAKFVLQSVAQLVFTQFIQPWVGGSTI